MTSEGLNLNDSIRKDLKRSRSRILCDPTKLHQDVTTANFISDRENRFLRKWHFKIVIIMKFYFENSKRIWPLFRQGSCNVAFISLIDLIF